jgi:hypothetical protein
VKITSIEVEASAVIPTRPFANVHPSLRLVATLDAGDDLEECTKKLQTVCNRLLLEHAEMMKNEVT